MIEVDIETLPAVVDTARAAAGDSLLFEASGSNLAVTYTAVLGDARAAFEGAYMRRERFDSQRYTAATMETRGLLAEWDAESSRLTVYGAAKVPTIPLRLAPLASLTPFEQPVAAHPLLTEAISHVAP